MMTIQEIINKQRLPIDELPILSSLRDVDKDEGAWDMIKAYLYGMMQGKRVERARRKRKR